MPCHFYIIKTIKSTQKLVQRSPIISHIVTDYLFKLRSSCVFLFLVFDFFLQIECLWGGVCVCVSVWARAHADLCVNLTFLLGNPAKPCVTKQPRTIKVFPYMSNPRICYIKFKEVDSLFHITMNYCLILMESPQNLESFHCHLHRLWDSQSYAFILGKILRGYTSGILGSLFII